MQLVTVGLIVLAIVAGVVALVVVTRQMERKRTEALRQVAQAAGLAFQPKAPVEAVWALGAVQLFERGHSKRVTNLMTGRLGDQQIAVFDYQFTTGSGKHRNTTANTVVLVPSANPSLPDLQMTPENPLLRIAATFGYQDINIDGSPEFSRSYVVKGPDEAAIRAALYPQATSYFAQHAGWTVEAHGGKVAIYRINRHPKPEEMLAFVNDACAAVRSL